MANWLKKYDKGGPIGPKAAPIRVNGTEVFEHGEDTATADKQENGVNPTNLTKKGVKYAESIGEEALNRGKKAVITSDVQRAKETADVIGKTANLPVYNNPILRTWDIGEYDGAPEGSFKEKQWATKPNTPVPGGESFDSFKARMEKAFEFAETAPKEADIVTHSKVTRAFKALHDTGGEWTDKTTKKFLSLKDEPKKKNGGWLDAYEQGGLVLKQKTHDNYDKQGNYNDADANVGPGFKGLAYNLQGRNYSPAWGGQFQDGGFLQPTSYKLPPAANEGTMSTEKSRSIGGEGGEPAYLIPTFKYGKPLKDPEAEYRKTGEHLGGPFKTWQEAEKFGEMRHQYVEQGRNIPSPYKWWDEFQMGGSLPGATGMMYARTVNPAPSNGKYAKKTKASAQNGKEMSFYQQGLDWTPKNISRDGSVIKDDMGQWAHPGEVTEINSNDITMEGVDYPVLGVSDTGDTKLMQPDQNYKFKGKKVTEYPMAKKGGWLNKYK